MQIINEIQAERRRTNYNTSQKYTAHETHKTNEKCLKTMLSQFRTFSCVSWANQFVNFIVDLIRQI